MGAGKKQGRDVTSCQKVAHILENLRWIVSAMWQQVLHWEVYLGNIDIIYNIIALRDLHAYAYEPYLSVSQSVS